MSPTMTGKSWLPAAAVMICIAPAKFAESLRGGRRELVKPQGAVACLTQEQCDRRRAKQGFGDDVYYVGDYETKGCFSKNGRAYFGIGGTVEAMAKENLQGVRTRIWCGLLDTDQPTEQPSISPPTTIAPISSKPTSSPSEPASDAGTTPIPTHLADVSTIAPSPSPETPTPTLPPSSEPSDSPTSSEPSDSPTKSPVTSEPSTKPSRSPTTSPSSNPSESPITSQPSNAKSVTLPKTSLEPSEAPAKSLTTESTTGPAPEESFESEDSPPAAELESLDGSTDLQPVESLLPVEGGEKLIENNVLYIFIGIFSVCFALIVMFILKTRRGRKLLERAESARVADAEVRGSQLREL